MPFPPENSDWPLTQDAARYDRIGERSVWYAGDPDDLRAFYQGSQPGGGVRSWLSGAGSGLHLGTGQSRRAQERASSKFWGTPQSGPLDEKVHLPVPEKIAHMSAEALFSDPPRFVVEGPTVQDPVTKKVTPAPETQKTQDRLDALVDQIGLLATLLSAAETASALGSVGLRLAWNPAIAQFPTITRADADAYFPFYDWGFLTGVLFWRVVYSDASQVWRHLELHEGGFIYHALYKGTPVSLGRLAPLSDHASTASLRVNEFGATFARPGLTTAVNVPNMLPDPMDRQNNAGRSDFTPACIGLFSAIDQTASSLMRDVEDGQSRLLVADYMLRNAGFGKGASWDGSERLFVSLKRQPGDTGQEAPIDQVQFDIRYQEHLAIIDDLTAKAVEAAGFTPDNEQGGEGAAEMTATEFVGRNKRTLATRDKKVLYWRAALEPLLTSLLIVDREVFGTQITPMPVKVVFPDAVQESPKSLAETAHLQKDSDASSRYTRVKTMHPDWDEADVEAELKRIEDEGAVDLETFGLPGAPPAPGAGGSNTEPEEEEAA
jgi:hypothetical protein